MAVISKTRNGMIGKNGKPFCGDCCAWFRKGSGKAWKRRGKHVEKQREKRDMSREIDAELVEAADAAEREALALHFGGDWTGYGCTVTEPCHERWCLPCNLNDEYHAGELCA